jgi:hypothetical protein
MNVMQLIKNTLFLILISAAAIAPASAAYAYVVTLTNGETIRALDYKIHDRKIELKLEGGSASFPRSLVASITGGSAEGRPPTPSSGATAAVRSPVRAPAPRLQASAEDRLRNQDVDKEDPDTVQEDGVKKPDDMTVEEYLDKEDDDGGDGDDAADAVDQDGNSEEEGFMPEDAGQGDKVTAQ